MDIVYHGNACVSIVTKPLVGDVHVVLDPYDNATGLRMPRTLAADVVFMSAPNETHGNREAIPGEPFVIDMPGEYEVKGVMFDARPTTDHNERQMILRVHSEGMTVGFLGGLARVLTDEELELLEGVDILILPTGGNGVLSPEDAAKVLREVEPRVVIPVMVEEEGLKRKLASVAAFKKAIGGIRTEQSNKFKMTQVKLPQDDMLLVELARA